MQVALTGASGLVGSHTASALATLGHDVVAFVRPTSRRDHLEPHVVRFVEGVLGDREAAGRLVEGVDAVIHAGVDWDAARGGNAFEHVRVNVAGTLDLLETARRAGVGQFVFVSSGAVHGEVLMSTIVETHPTWPHDTYGGGKAAVEPFLKAYHHTHGMNTSVWRPVGVYGLAPDVRRSRWYELIDAARRGRPVDKSGGGKVVDVRDVADALAFAAGDPEVAGGIFNLCDGYAHTYEVAEAARELAGNDGQVVRHPSAGPKNVFDISAATQFFDRHGRTSALRRGLSGVRAYVAEVLAASA